MATWRELIKGALEECGETWDDIEGNTLTESGLDVEFYDGYGGEEGLPFTMWTVNHVYFPVCYDGSEWCGYVPRNVCNKPTGHHGGG